MDTWSSTGRSKRSRDSEDSSTELSSEPTLDPIQADDLKPFTCLRKIRDMDPDNLLQYFPNLPERTQYFDTGKLVEAKLNPDDYYADQLSTWRAVRTYSDVAYSYFDHPPASVNMTANAPPLSSLKMKLRASVTYNTLFERILKRRDIDERIEQLTLATAKKTLDYLLLSYIQCTQAQINQYLPAHEDWFEGAANVIIRLTNTSRSTNGVLQSFTLRGPRVTSALVSSGNDSSVDYDRQVENMILKLSSDTDPWVQWDNIHGNEQVKEELYSNLFLALPRKEQVNNLLLFGPTGTGKSMLSLCAARMAGWTVFDLTPDVIMHKYQGESEKMIAAIFKRAGECQPACIIIDEADYLFARRSDNHSEGGTSIGCLLLAAMSRVIEEEDMHVMIIATTMLPESFDEGLLRRFFCCVYVGLPDQGAILAILKQKLAAYELADDVTDERLHNLATEVANRRTLSGYDVTRALEIELERLLMKSWNVSKYFREEVLDNGERIILPCSSIEDGAFICKKYRFSVDQITRLKLRKVDMADIERVIRGTVAITTKATVQRFEAFNREKGMQWH